MTNRPRMTDPDVFERYCVRMAKDLIAHGATMVEGMPTERVIDGLRYAGRPAHDGYDYVKQLEAAGWSGIGAEDVEVLDFASSVLSEAHREAERKWVDRAG